MNIYEVIMAGGGGSRFWPLSRQALPKQLLNLSGKDIMLNETILRMEPLVPRENAYIVTNEGQAGTMKKLLLEGVDKSHVLAEPMGRNTAPCILYAALVLKKYYGDGVMCVLPADHHIANTKEYRRVMEQAAKAADETGQIVTIGIQPDYAATGYGYISCGQETERAGVYKVKQFVEKPCKEVAEKYLAEGSYLWNSGVFVWKISTILRAFEKFLPEMYEAMQPVYEAVGTDKETELLKKIYPTLQSISVDYGIMEQCEDVLVLKGDYGWNDVGSLDALPTFHPLDEQENLLLGDVMVEDAKGCIVRGHEKLIALVGVEDMMVIDTEDALLVCPKERAQDVKKIVERLQKENRKEQ